MAGGMLARPWCQLWPPGLGHMGRGLEDPTQEDPGCTPHPVQC